MQLVCGAKGTRKAPKAAKRRELAVWMQERCKTSV